ncbi:MAG: DUF6782 family putative metallopeptidase [Alphaproteobacteria bacterium]
MKKDPEKSLRKRFNARARRASAVVLSSVMFFGAAGCSTTGKKAEADPVKTEQPLVPQRAASPPPPPPPAVTPYDFDLFEKNALSLPPSVLLQSMTPEERRQYFMSKLCFTSGNKANDEVRQQELHDALEDLSKIKNTGASLVAMAVADKLKVCALQHLPSGVAAQYLPSLDTVVASHQEPREERALKMAHEILHAAQGQHALLYHGYNWDIESRVRVTLATEAAAQAVEFLVAFEAHVAGDDRYWNHVQGYGGTTYGDAEIYKKMQQAYDNARSGAKTEDEALRLAGRAAFERIFESADWRNYYLNLELQSYLSDVAYNAFAGKGAPVAGFRQADVDFAGLAGDKTSFTAGAAMPPAADMIARNQKMNWAYQAVDIARHEQAFGAMAPETVALFNKAVFDNNPYLLIDVKELYAATGGKHWATPREYKYLYEVMDEIAGVKKQPVPAIRKPEKPRPPAFSS